MKFLNLNAAQTALSAALAVLPFVAISLGCTQLLNGTLECSNSTILSPSSALWLSAIIAALKFGIIPAIQDGGWARNLFSVKVPVSTSGAPGTVSTDQIAPPAVTPPSP